MKTKLIVIICSLVLSGFDSTQKVRIFLAGDSTMADKPLIDNPEHGWGQMLPMFFTRDVAVFNHARNGRSTRSFLLEGRWDSLMTNVRAGDYVFIQFGHNDSKKEDTSRYADANSDYKNNLLRFVSDVRTKNGIPVLITPVNRRNYDSTGKFIDKHGEYPNVVRSVALQEHVLLIDLHAKSKSLFEKLGEKLSQEYFLASVKPNIYRALPDGKVDNTHFTHKGAVAIAQLVADGINELDILLKQSLSKPEPTSWMYSGIVIGLDQYYNNEWKKTKDSAAFRYHYTWQDTMDSGFSELGKIFDRAGADVDTINSAPTDSSMKRFSAFIIVDPDTPKETAVPNYLHVPEIDVIVRWVKNGGVLVLMGNDKGNAEFENFNKLSERFGIHFNEDMHQDVKNNQYDSGMVTKFPHHKIFNNVHHAFIKQFSSLTVTTPSRAILKCRGVTVMAESKYGAGRVFAIGDPWLYNEYIDNRRVPPGYENYDAAYSFVQWVCSQSKKVR